MIITFYLFGHGVLFVLAVKTSQFDADESKSLVNWDKRQKIGLVLLLALWVSKQVYLELRGIGTLPGGSTLPVPQTFGWTGPKPVV